MQRDHLYNNFRRTCPICGKEFGMFDPAIWVYQDHRGKYFCSWTCYNKFKRKQAEKHTKVMEEKARRDRSRLEKTRVPKVGLPMLREIRNRRGMTQPQLAVVAGVCINTIASWEKGAANPQPEKLKRLCDALGCTEEELRGMK